jgi:hypothetical protein
MKHTFLSGTLAIGAIATVAAFQAAPASAFSWTSNSATFEAGDLAGTEFTVAFDQGYIDGVFTPGLTSVAKFSLVSGYRGGSSAVLRVAVTNTSSGQIFKRARVSGIGFNTSPELKSVSLSKGSAFNTVAFDSRLPQPQITGGKKDICFSAKVSCTGGGGGGVELGRTSIFTTTLAFKAPSGVNLTSFDLSDFAVRYQSIDFVDGPTGLSGVGVGKVPTPALLPGLIGMGIAAFRKKKQQGKEVQSAAS